MHPGALRTLEFDRIIEAVARCALTPMGEERLERLQPSTDLPTVAQLLSGTSETARYLALNGALPLAAVRELPDILDALAVAGRVLDAPRLLALAVFLDSIDESRAAIRRAPGSFPLLETVAGGAASFKGETGQLRDKIDPTGEVVDHASPELKLIRDRLRKQRVRLRSTLESYVRGKDTSKYLQEQIVTERSGRYVLLVKAEHRSAIPGIIHGASTSGASLFLEPLSTVEINNDIVALEEQEAEEVRRILLALSDSFRARAGDLQRTIQVATELDVLQARARYSASIDGVEPTLASDGAFELLDARNPLLLMRAARGSTFRGPWGRPEPSRGTTSSPPAEKDTLDLSSSRVGGAQGDPERVEGSQGEPPVPVTIKVIPPASVLLITGPNTGGKTVALKTAGLLALMAQSGLWIPAAEGSRLPVFLSIFADIGDEQSIESSLSTFSAHITNIAGMDRALAMPALVLLDEVGSGTDPIEGGALGVAIVDHFRRRGARVIATSHYDTLKTYASTTEGVASAAFGFAPETFAPTYRLVYGSPGRSLALEMAARVGLNASIVTAARENLTAREAQLAGHLAKIDRDMRALEHEQRLASKEREALEASGARMRQREEALRHREETFRRRLTDEMDQMVREARREIDQVIADLKARAAAIASAPRLVSTGDTGGVRSDARAAVDNVAKRALEGAPAQQQSPPDQSANKSAISHQQSAIEGLSPGARVIVGGLGLEAIVTAVHDGTADLDVRGKRMRASIRDLRLIAPGSAAPARVSVNVHLAEGREALSSSSDARSSSAVDLNVIGCTVDEAIARAERFLDESLLTDQRVVRLIHGYGTGQLKRALAGFLQQHPLVARFATAPPDQGGGGVTVVELKE